METKAPSGMLPEIIENNQVENQWKLYGYGNYALHLIKPVILLHGSNFLPQVVDKCKFE